ncbi:MAG: hypothetical protein LUI87_00080 [Lachnospiraceae bacterium]|nr:hypothetical protein [Lachnospiraceae bacterium]
MAVREDLEDTVAAREDRAADSEAALEDRAEAVSEAAREHPRRRAGAGADMDIRAEAAAALHFSVCWR